MAKETRSLLSSQALVQAPWIKVTIGNYTFGVYSKVKAATKNANDFYSSYNIQYPNYVKDLTITKINGQVNQYTLNIVYPIKPGDDPNFFEKVFSSVSATRKIVFSYGDASMPTYCYKDEEAIITKVGQTFSLEGSQITYTVYATSSAALGKTGSFTFIGKTVKPSDEIKRIFKDSRYGLRGLFTGMSDNNINELIAGDDAVVKIYTKTNVSPLDYISYLAGCMVPAGTIANKVNKDIYILTIHDETVYDKLYNDTVSNGGPYFKISRSSYDQTYSDAYEIDIGFNTATVVLNFSVEQNENYSMYYDYANKLYPEEYVRRINSKGEWEDVYAPTSISKNDRHKADAEDTSWYTKLTKYPINANITIQGLLRPALLMQYVRLNVIFPGGGKHISSGLYIITKQQDSISSSGYRTQLSMTRIEGDTNV